MTSRGLRYSGEVDTLSKFCTFNFSLRKDFGGELHRSYLHP